MNTKGLIYMKSRRVLQNWGQIVYCAMEAVSRVGVRTILSRISHWLLRMATFCYFNDVILGAVLPLVLPRPALFSHEPVFRYILSKLGAVSYGWGEVQRLRLIQFSDGIPISALSSDDGRTYNSPPSINPRIAIREAAYIYAPIKETYKSGQNKWYS